MNAATAPRPDAPRRTTAQHLQAVPDPLESETTDKQPQSRGPLPWRSALRTLGRELAWRAPAAALGVLLLAVVLAEAARAAAGR